MAPPLSTIIDVAAAALMVALGGGVLLVRPRTRASLALGAYCIFFGARETTRSLLPNSDPRGVLLVALYAGAIASMLVIMLSFPRPLALRDPLARGVLALLAVGGSVGFALEWYGHDSAGSALLTAQLPSAVGAVMLWALFAAGFLFALRYARTPPEAAIERRDYAILTVGLVLFNAVQLAAWFTRDAGSSRWPFVAASVLYGALMLALAIAWVRAGRTDPRGARNVTLAIVVASLVGMAVELAALADAIERQGFYGALRLPAVAVFAYAILRHQMLGLDVRVRWTIQRGTIAALFVGVFLVSTNVAQNVFSTQWGPLFGGVAAGLLFFGLAPLQRAAERLADRAVPMADAKPSAPRAADTFRNAVRLALHDGAMTRAEEKHLARIADDLGLKHADAIALREEVERELAG